LIFNLSTPLCYGITFKVTPQYRTSIFSPNLEFIRVSFHLLKQKQTKKCFNLAIGFRAKKKQMIYFIFHLITQLLIFSEFLIVSNWIIVL